MIRHIVMWQLKESAEGADKLSNARKMKALLESCKDLVPGILKLEVALAEAGLECTCDIILHMEFDSAHSLDAYQMHPHHVAMKSFIGAVRESRHCMDYLVPVEPI